MLMILWRLPSELDDIIVILGRFRWIHNERYLDVNILERLLMLHTIEHVQ